MYFLNANCLLEKEKEKQQQQKTGQLSIKQPFPEAWMNTQNKLIN